MSTQNFTMKRWSGSEWVTLYPKTIPSQTGLLDNNTNKISLSYIPDSVFGGMQYYGSLKTPSSGTVGATFINTILDNGSDWDLYTSTSSSKKAKGRYLVAEASVQLPTPNTSFTITINGASKYAKLSPVDGMLDEDAAGLVEAGDWVIFEGLKSGSGTSSDPYVYGISIVNNTYQTASGTAFGIVKLADTTALTTSMTGVVPTAAQVVSYVGGRGFVTSSGVTSITLKAGTGISLDTDNTAITGTGTRTISLATSGVTAGTYRSVTVDAYGRVTAGTAPTTLSGYGITDAKIANGIITLGSTTITPLTSHQSLAHLAPKESPTLNKVTLTGETTINGDITLSTLAYGTAAGNLRMNAQGGITIDTTSYLTTSGTAASASKLSVNGGSTSTPIYFANGVPTAVTSVSTSLIADASTSGKGLMSVSHFKQLAGLATLSSTAPTSPVEGEIYFAI